MNLPPPGPSNKIEHDMDMSLSGLWCAVKFILEAWAVALVAVATLFVVLTPLWLLLVVIYLLVPN